MTSQPIVSHSKKPTSIRSQLIRRAVVDAFRKLNPRWMIRNPVMFVVLVGSVATTALWIQALVGAGEAPARIQPRKSNRISNIHLNFAPLADFPVLT